MFDLLELVSNQSLVVLYTLQSLTYVVAASMSRQSGHKDLAGCYTVSAVVHTALAECHVLHLV